MENIHNKNILFLEQYIEASEFPWVDYSAFRNISYFFSGGGTHLYLFENGDKKFIARINFYPGKNEWKVKRTEYETLKEIEHLSISAKPYLLDENNALKQDMTIVEYIAGENIAVFLDSDISAIAKDLKKLHSFPKKYNKKQKIPYKCSIYNEFANGEDKKIEAYPFPEIYQVFTTYNRIKVNLGEWFNNLPIFHNCENLCLCHADLKSENILRTESGVMLIDWECAEIDIPETDIGRLFSGCVFTERQQSLFMTEYYGHIPPDKVQQRIKAIKMVLDFFRIIENYCIHKRKPFNVVAMLNDLRQYEMVLETLRMI